MGLSRLRRLGGTNSKKRQPNVRKYRNAPCHVSKLYNILKHKFGTNDKEHRVNKRIKKRAHELTEITKYCHKRV